MSMLDQDKVRGGSTRKPTKQVFDATSPGFAYTLIVGILTILAAIGVHFPTQTETLAGEILTTFTAGGIYSIIGIVAASIIFPIYNAIKSGSFQWAKFKSSTLTYVALANIAIAALALFKFVLPEGSGEQLVLAIMAKDWIAIGSFFFTVIVPTFVRWIKGRNRGEIG